MGIPEYEAKRYEGRVKNGGVLLSVHSDNSEWTGRAKKLLEDTGAEDIASASEAKADFEKTDRPMPRGLDADARAGLDKADTSPTASERMIARERVNESETDAAERGEASRPDTFRKDH